MILRKLVACFLEINFCRLVVVGVFDAIEFLRRLSLVRLLPVPSAALSERCCRQG